MPDMVNDQNLTFVESFSLTEKLTHKMAEWNQSKTHPKAGPLAARMTGCALVAITALADTFIHLALTLGKCFLIAKVIIPFVQKSKFPLSSPLVHLTMTVQSLFKVIILPFICLLDPTRAYWMSKLTQDGESLLLQKDLNDLERQMKKDQVSYEVLLKQHGVKKNGELPPKADGLNANQPIALLNEELNQIRIALNEKNNEIVKYNTEIVALQQKQESAHRIQEMRIQKENLEKQLVLFQKNENGNPEEVAEKIVQMQNEAEIQILRQKIQSLNENIVEINLQDIQLNIDDLTKEIELLQERIVVAEKVKQELTQKFESGVKNLNSLKTKKDEHSGDKQTQTTTPLLTVKKGEVDLGEDIFNQDLELDDVPPPPPPPEDDLGFSSEPIYKKHVNFFEGDAGDGLEENGKAKPADPWWFSKEAQNTTDEAHKELMKVLKNVDEWKAKKINIAENKLALKPKHEHKIKILFERRNKEGLLRIKAHIQELDEILDEALKTGTFNARSLTESIIEDMGQSFIGGMANIAPENFSQELEKMIAYTALYAKALVQPLEELRVLHNQRKAEEERPLDDVALKKKAENELKLEMEQKHKEGYLTAKEAVAQLKLRDGKYKIYEQGPEEEFHINEEMTQTINMRVKTTMFLKRVSKEQFKTIGDFTSALETLSKTIENIKPNEDKAEKIAYYKPDDNFKLLKGIVDQLNDRKFKNG